MTEPVPHAVNLAAEAETGDFALRVLDFEVCGNPDCGCAAFSGEPLRVFTAPDRGRYDDWLYLGPGDDLDEIVSTTADLIGVDAETGPSVYAAASALHGLPWSEIVAAPARVIVAQSRAIEAMTDRQVEILTETPIEKLRAIGRAAREATEHRNGGFEG